MTQVISIIKHCGPNDLVLLDELGSGTDPEEGSALAVSILEFFRKRGSHDGRVPIIMSLKLCIPYGRY